jgi:hypothetical protein
MIEYDRAILRAYIGSLAVQGCGVMSFPEEVQKLFEGDLCRIIGDTSYLRMAGSAGAHLFVGRIGCGTASVPRLNGLDPFDAFKNRLNAPETAGAKGCFFKWCHTRYNTVRATGIPCILPPVSGEGRCLAITWQFPGTHLVLPWHSPGTYLALTWYLAGIHLVLTWYSPGHCNQL